MDEILGIPDRSGIKLAFGLKIFPFVVSEIMKGALGKMYLWVTRYALGINPIKAERTRTYHFRRKRTIAGRRRGAEWHVTNKEFLRQK